MERKDRNWLAGVAGVSAGLMLLVGLLIFLCPSPASGPLPTPKPTASPPPKPSPKPTSTALPTSTAGPHDGNGDGGTVQPTSTAGGQDGTPVQEATPTPSATVVEHPGLTVYFNQSAYSVEGSETFWTGVMISEVDYFWGAQFDIEYDYTLIEARPGAARRGSLYDVETGNWTEADFLSVTEIEDGLVRLQISWENYPGDHGGRGIDVSGGTLAHLKWKAATGTGAASLNFVGKESISKLLVGFGPQPTDAWVYTGVIWTNSSVSVH